MFGIDVEQIRATGAQVLAFVQEAKKSMAILGQNDVKIMARINEVDRKMDMILAKLDVASPSVPFAIIIEEESEHARIESRGI